MPSAYQSHAATFIAYTVCGNTDIQPGTLYLYSLSFWDELLIFTSGVLRGNSMYLFCAEGIFEKVHSHSLTFLFPLLSGYKK